MLTVYDSQDLFVLIHCDAIGVGRCQLPFCHSPLLQQRKQQKQTKKKNLKGGVPQELQVLIRAFYLLHYLSRSLQTLGKLASKSKIHISRP